MKEKEEKACLCALAKTFGFKPKTALALIEQFGDARSVFALNKEEKEAVFGPFSLLKDKISNEEVEKADHEIDRLEKSGIHFTGWTLDSYPPKLKECEDAPIGLYIRSDTGISNLWKPKKSFAVVGTRDISAYGKEWCEKIVDGLASSDARPLIVSGLALGTDICAHRRALDDGLPTIGVMATGPEDIYPYRNRKTAEAMIHKEGCALVTDYPPGTPPLAIHFLRRNRIIAGLSDATILVESKIRGGGMMTARLAFSYSRDVMTLPGRIDDIRSQGCNLLIRNKIASPITSVAEMIDDLGMKTVDTGFLKREQIQLENIFGKETDCTKIGMMKAIISGIRSEREITIEELSYNIGMPYYKTLELCGILESEGIISIDLLQRCSIKTNFS